jgi:hypothetical protein
MDRLIEVNDLQLDVWINEARLVDSGVQAGVAVSQFGAIQTDKSCNRYKVKFDNYTAYSVINESYWSESEDGKVVIGSFVTYERSKFSDYVNSVTSKEVAEDIAEAKSLHYQITCLNHLINVVTCYPPQIEIVTAALIK